MSAAELLPLIEQYREAQQIIEAAQAEMEAIKEKVRTEMTARSTNKLDVGTHRITLQTVTTHRLDSKAIKAAAPELAEKFTVTTTGTRFVVA